MSCRLAAQSIKRQAVADDNLCSLSLLWSKDPLMKHRTVIRGERVQNTRPVTAMSVCLALREPIPLAEQEGIASLRRPEALTPHLAMSP